MKISPAQSDFLNWSRWLAAWLVVAEHARSLIFVDYGELHSPRLLAKAFYFLTGFGHEAVMVFFVISGYLVGGKVWSLYVHERFEWRRYLADRLSRLYAVLIVALVLGAFLDWSGYLFFNKYGLYNQGHEGSIAVLGSAPIDRMGWRDFLLNALFLQTIEAPSFGSNGPLWSLAYEWWYYILFPLLLAAVWPIVYGSRQRLDKKAESGNALKGKADLTTELKEDGMEARLPSQFSAPFLNSASFKLAQDFTNTSPSGSANSPASAVTSCSKIAKHTVSMFACLFAVAGVCWFLTWDILILFSVWLLGVAAAVLGPKIFSFESLVFRLAFLVSSTGVFLGSLLLARLEVLQWGAVDQFLIGIGFALLLAALAPMAWRFPWRSFAHNFADFSYSVYLIHFPVIVFALSIAFDLFGNGIRMRFGCLALCWYACIFSLAISMSWLISLFTEKKTANLRRFLYGLLNVS